MRLREAEDEDSGVVLKGMIGVVVSGWCACVRGGVGVDVDVVVVYDRRDLRRKPDPDTALVLLGFDLVTLPPNVGLGGMESRYTLKWG